MALIQPRPGGLEPGIPRMKHWYALYTKPRNEYLVRDWLESRGFETFLPTLTQLSKRRPPETRERPFFARYLFTRLDLLTVALSSVNWAPGVTSIVSFDGQPAAVPDQVIEWLRDRLAYANRFPCHESLALRPNDRVRIAAGPLRGMEAIFDQHLSAQGRARVLIDLLGRLTACEIDLASLRPLRRGR